MQDALLRQFQKEIEDLRRQLAENDDSGSGYESEEVDDEGNVRSKSRVSRHRFMSNHLYCIDAEVRKKKPHRSSSSTVAELERKIDAERKQLQKGINMVEAEKKRVREDIEKKEQELKKAKLETGSNKLRSGV